MCRALFVISISALVKLVLALFFGYLNNYSTTSRYVSVGVYASQRYSMLEVVEKQCYNYIVRKVE